MYYKREDMFYTYISLDNRTKVTKAEYTLWFVDDKLVEVRNIYGYKVDLKSECWAFFNNKYNVI